MVAYKAQGVVLHTIKYGDSGLVVYLYTDVGGRQTLMLNGVRASGTKGNRAALLQPMQLIEFEGVEVPHGRLHRLRDVRGLLPVSAVSFDPCKSTISMFMAEVMYRLIREEEPNAALFNFVSLSVRSLNVMSDGVANFHLWFLVKLSAYMGFYPIGHYADRTFFDIKSGQFVILPPMHRMYFERRDSEILAQMMECSSPIHLPEIKLTRGERVSFLNAMLNFIGYHSDSINAVRSVDILREVF